MCAKSSFRQTYALVRANRRNQHFANQFFNFGSNGEIYIAPGGRLIIARKGKYDEASLHTQMLLGNTRGLALSRRHFIGMARESGPIPLPKV